MDYRKLKLHDHAHTSYVIEELRDIVTITSIAIMMKSIGKDGGTV